MWTQPLEAKYAFAFTVAVSVLAHPAYIGNQYFRFDSRPGGKTIRTVGRKLLAAASSATAALR